MLIISELGFNKENKFITNEHTINLEYKFRQILFFILSVNILEIFEIGRAKCKDCQMSS